jgi:hypothetical protein
MINAILGLGQLVVEQFGEWSRRRHTISEAKLRAELAKIEAEAELASYKLKADVEWDLAWAGQAERSWKDEYLLILFTLPIWGFLVGLFIPDFRPAVMMTLDWLKEIHPLIMEFYLGALAVIVSAVYGVRAFAQGWLPGRVATIAGAFSQVQDDIPDEAVDTATQRVRDFIDQHRRQSQRTRGRQDEDKSSIVLPPQPN